MLRFFFSLLAAYFVIIPFFGFSVRSIYASINRLNRRFLRQHLEMQQEQQQQKRQRLVRPTLAATIVI